MNDTKQFKSDLFLLGIVVVNVAGIFMNFDERQGKAFLDYLSEESSFATFDILALSDAICQVALE